MKKLISQAWILLPIFILLAAAVASWRIIGPGQNSSVVNCEGERAQDFNCWQNHYNSLVVNRPTEKVFKDFRDNYASNEFVKTNCHQIAHVIGRASAKKYSSLAETYAHGDNFCWSGYYHGAIETIAAEIGRDKIVSQINVVCADFQEDHPYSFDHYNCVHGMGHGLMAVQSRELFTALKSCDEFDGTWQQNSCYSGVFMENVMNSINPGEISKYLKTDDPFYPCTAVNDKYKEQCYLMQTSHALNILDEDYAKVFDLCEGLDSRYKKVCFQSLGRDISGNSSSDRQSTLSNCMKGTSAEAQENCFVGAVKDFISFYHDDQEGLKLCQSITEASIAKICNDEAVEYYKTF